MFGFIINIIFFFFGNTIFKHYTSNNGFYVKVRKFLIFYKIYTYSTHSSNLLYEFTTDKKKVSEYIKYSLDR